MQAESIIPIKASLYFWHREHGSTVVVLTVSLLLEIARQFAGYINSDNVPVSRILME